MIRAKLRWEYVPVFFAEQLMTAFSFLLPRGIIEARVKRSISSQAFGCDSDEVFLFKSGRAAIRGILEGLREADPDHCVVLIPDYTCTAVAKACVSAGYQVIEYPVGRDFQPDWPALGSIVESQFSPVVVLCSMFGVTPASTAEAAKFHSSYPQAFVIADECQNLVPNSPVAASPWQAIVFSFNDKNCPGIMGGGAVVSRDGAWRPRYFRSGLLRRALGALALFRHWIFRLVRDLSQMARLVAGNQPRYFAPAGYEYSTCDTPHYDCTPEIIYKISAARAVASLRFLSLHRRFVVQNANILAASALGELSVSVPFDLRDLGPAQVPIEKQDWRGIGPSVAPVKAPYARYTNKMKCSRPVAALRTFLPHVRYVDDRTSTTPLARKGAKSKRRQLGSVAGPGCDRR